MLLLLLLTCLFQLAPLLRRPVSGDIEEDERSRQIRLRLDTYTLKEMSDVNPLAYYESGGLRNRRFIGFVTDKDPDSLKG